MMALAVIEADAGVVRSSHLRPQVAHLGQVVHDQQLERSQPGRVDQASPGNARGFAIEEKQQGEQEKDQDADRPAEHPEALEQHGHQVEDGVELLAPHTRDLANGDSGEPDEHDANQEASGQVSVPPQGKQNGSGGVFAQGNVDPLGKGLLESAGRGQFHTTL
jgi:hypothetical protein